MMIGDGVVNDGSASLRLYERPGVRYFAKDGSGTRRIKVSGVWISYRKLVYNVSERREEYHRVVAVNKYNSKTKVQIEELFIPEDTMTYLSLAGNYIVEGIEINSVTPSKELVNIKLDLDDLVVDAPGTIKTIKHWDARESKPEDFTVTGKYIKPNVTREARKG